MSFLTFLLAIGVFFKYFPGAASFLVNLNFAFWMFLLISWGVSEFGWNFWTIFGVVLLVLGLLGVGK